jgi:hypothetical protein
MVSGRETRQISERIFASQSTALPTQGTPPPSCSTSPEALIHTRALTSPSNSAPLGMLAASSAKLGLRPEARSGAAVRVWLPHMPDTLPPSAVHHCPPSRRLPTAAPRNRPQLLSPVCAWHSWPSLPSLPSVTAARYSQPGPALFPTTTRRCHLPQPCLSPTPFSDSSSPCPPAEAVSHGSPRHLSPTAGPRSSLPRMWVTAAC